MSPSDFETLQVPKSHLLSQMKDDKEPLELQRVETDES